MEIETKISFKHGAIMRILKKHGIKPKQFAVMCGWKYQNLLQFINFDHLPKIESKEKLFDAIKLLDNKITETEIFPDIYNKACSILNTKIINNEIPDNLLLSFEKNQIDMEYEDEGIKNFELTHDFNLLKKDLDKMAIPEAYSTETTTKMKLEIFKMYFGIGYDRTHTLKECSEKFFITPENARQSKEKMIRKFKRSFIFNKYKHLIES